MPARQYAALDVVWPDTPADDAVDLVAADLDAFGPTAIEEHPSGVRVFFGSEDDRDRARALLANTHPHLTCAAVSVSDEAWAERSQAALGPVRVGRIVVAPPWISLDNEAPGAIVVRIQPSMGFGTGHHASTRLCLHLLQEIPLEAKSMLDIGTGSGVLAIAAWRLGADPVLAIDVDEDAVTSAAENIELNGAAVTLRTDDVLNTTAPPGDRFEIVTANLTGSLLERAAPELATLVAHSGSLIASGFQTDELAPVTEAFRVAGLDRQDTVTEDGWLGVRFRRA